MDGMHEKIGRAAARRYPSDTQPRKWTGTSAWKTSAANGGSLIAEAGTTSFPAASFRLQP